jgi:hypothetical protein
LFCILSVSAQADVVITIYAEPPRDGGWGHAQLHIEGIHEGRRLNEWYGWAPSAQGFGLLNDGSLETYRSSENSVPSVATSLSGARYQNIKSLIAAWKVSADYNALLNNCVTFVREIAERSGLNVPSDIGKTPDEFMADLLRANPSKVMTPVGRQAKEGEVATLAAEVADRFDAGIYETRVRDFNSRTRTLQNRVDRIIQRRDEIVETAVSTFEKSLSEVFSADDAFNHAQFRATRIENAAQWHASQNAAAEVRASMQAAAGGGGFTINLGGTGEGNAGGGSVPGSPSAGSEKQCWTEFCYKIVVPGIDEQAPSPVLGGTSAPRVAASFGGGRSDALVSFIDIGNVLPDEEHKVRIEFLPLNMPRDVVLLYDSSNVVMKHITGIGDREPIYSTMTQETPSDTTLEMQITVPTKEQSKSAPSIHVYKSGELMKAIYILYTVFSDDEIATERRAKAVSGFGNLLSEEYRLCSGPTPVGYEQTFSEPAVASMNPNHGRECSKWAECKIIEKSVNNTCFGYRVMGHEHGICLFCTHDAPTELSATLFARFRYRLRRQQPRWSGPLTVQGIQ